MRGLSPYPAAHAKLQNPNGEIIDVKIFSTEIVAKCSDFLCVGSINTDGKTHLSVKVKDGFVNILDIQQAGKKMMPIVEFLKGARISEDWRFVM